MKRIFPAFLVLQAVVMLLLPPHVQAEETVSPATRVRGARIFTTPIEWIGKSEPAEGESLALESALQAFEKSGIKAGYEAFEGFLANEVNSPWAPSLRTHLAERYRVMGRYTAAIRHWEQAWQRTKQSDDPKAKAISARALAGWLGLLGSLGRRDQMDELMAESQKLGLLDTPYAHAIRSSFEGLSVMKVRPSDAFRCGSLALSEVMKRADENKLPWREVRAMPSPGGGFTMDHLVKLAASNGFHVVAIRRDSGDKIPVPSVVHWRLDHYAAIVEQDGDRYKVIDPTFGTPNWLDAQTINEEASGHFLVPTNRDLPGGRPLTSDEAAVIHGKGYTQGINDDDDSSGDDDDDDDCDPPEANDGPEGGGSPCPTDAGMPVWSISDPFMTLWIHDTPLYYRNTRGGWEKLRLSYKHRTTPRNDTVAGFGDGWECNWIGFLEKDSANTTTIKNYMAGGGVVKFATDGTREFHSGRKLLLNAGAPDKIISPGKTPGGAGASSRIATGAPVNRNSAGRPPSADEIAARHGLPEPRKEPVGGSENRYGSGVSYGAGITRYFRTSQADRYLREKTYSFSQVTVSSTVYHRLTTRTDKDGKSATLSYTNTAFPRLITSVTDPYGRSAHFIYDGSGRLTNIIDMAGLSSSFSYHSDGSITNMVTPDGTNGFRYLSVAGGDGEWRRGIEVAEPGGTKQLATYHDGPLWNTNWLSFNLHMFSFHWNRAQYAAIGPSGKSDPLGGMISSDFELTGATEWLRNYDTAMLNGTPWRKWDAGDPQYPGARINFVEFTYPNQFYNYISFTRQPSMLVWSNWQGNEISDVIQTPRNDWGRPTEISYLRGSSYISFTNKYDADGRRLLEVWGPKAERVRGYAYDATRTNLLTSVTNALNEVIKYTYDSSARVTSITHPGGLVVSNTYYTSGTNAGFLEKRMELGVRTNQYAWINGNLEWHTDEMGLATKRLWDSLNRITSIIYPDGTATSNVYKNLDLVATKDRRNQWTYFGYNRFHQMIALTNANGQVTEWDYCGCGSPSEMKVWNGAVPHTTSYAYNMAGRLANVVHPDGFSMDYYYDLRGRLSKVVESGAKQFHLTYTNQNSLASVFLDHAQQGLGGYLLQRVYDQYGRVARETNRNMVVITNGYDVLGRLTVRATLDSAGNLSNTVSYAHTPVGVTNITDELGRTTWFVHDSAGRLLFQTNANAEVLKFTYNGTGQMLTFKDARNKETKWNYDEYGRVTNKVDAAGNVIFRYKYDALNRLTNRWTPAKGDTFYAFDPVGNLTSVDYPGGSSDLTFLYDALNRLTNVVDAVGTTSFGYNAAGLLTSEDGPWNEDTLSYTYDSSNRERASLSLSRPDAAPWLVNYIHDPWHGLESISTEANAFYYDYGAVEGVSNLVKKVWMGGWWYAQYNVHYEHDTLGRLKSTTLKNNSGTVLNQHRYNLDVAGRRTRQALAWGDSNERYWDYTYDNIDQLRSAKGTDHAWDYGTSVHVDTSRSHEQFGYGYDAAGNLSYRTNNALVQSYTVDDNNQLSSATRSGTLTVAGFANQPKGGHQSWGNPSGVSNVTVSGTGLTTGNASLYADGSWAKTGATLANGANTYTATARNTSNRTATDSVTVNLPTTASFSYDSNGNLTGDGLRTFEYDAENQLTAVQVAGQWRSDFRYDAFGRRRVRREFTWQGGVWLPTNEVRYVYDGMLVIQERDALNLPRVTYTRGPDLSGSLESAGGIGGLLARTEHSGTASTHSYYHADGNGNITALVDIGGTVLARYAYDPYGNLLGKSGPMADVNLYRFSSKELHASGGLYYYGYRYYEPNLQRWLNRDPLGDIADFIHLPWNSAPSIEMVGTDLNVDELFPAWVQANRNLYGAIGNNAINDVDHDGLLVGNIVAGLVGGGVDLGLQLLSNGGRWDCVSWASVGISAAATGAGYGLASTFSKLGKLGRAGRVLEKAGKKTGPLTNYMKKEVANANSARKAAATGAAVFGAVQAAKHAIKESTKDRHPNNGPGDKGPCP